MMMKSAIIQQQPQNQTESKLRRLKTQIYKPYHSILNEQQQKNQPSISTKKLSLPLKSKHSVDSFLFNSKRKSTKLPKIKKRTSILAEDDNQISVASFVSDPFLNGRINHVRAEVYSKFAKNSDQYNFLKTVQAYQLEFLQNCHNKKYKPAQECIQKLLNYTIDLNLIDFLCYTLKIMGDFHFQCFQTEKALFYYNEGRKCGLLIGQNQFMVECLIKMSHCAIKANLYTEGIRFLKKGLQYIWYFGLESLELKVYDQIGKIYYIMGDAEKAKQYHHRFFSGYRQPSDSSIKLLSKESLVLEGLQDMKIIRSISTIFLWMIRIPIKSCEHFPQFGFLQNQSKESQSPRKHYTKDMTYFQSFKSLKNSINGILNEDFFKNQIGEIYDDAADWTIPNRNKKYLSFDIQRNNHLLSLGIPFQNYFSKPKTLKIKLPVTIKTKIKTQQNSQQNTLGASTLKNVDDWFNNITAQAIRKYRNRNQSISNRVQIRGIDKQPQPKTSIFRIIYDQYFQLSHQQLQKLHHYIKQKQS